MKRRAATSSKASKARRRKAASSKRPAALARRSRSSDASLRDELARFQRDLKEALEQQTATSEVLKVISSSPGDLEPVFRTKENAVRICEAKFGALHRYDGRAFHPAAGVNVPIELIE